MSAARRRRRAAHVGEPRAAQRDLAGHLEPARTSARANGMALAGRRCASASAAGGRRPSRPARRVRSPRRSAPSRRADSPTAAAPIGEAPPTTPSTIAASRSALIWSETMRRLSRAWSSASGSSWTRAGSTNQPPSSGRSRSSAERSSERRRSIAGRGVGDGGSRSVGPRYAEQTRRQRENSGGRPVPSALRAAPSASATSGPARRRRAVHPRAASGSRAAPRARPRAACA